MIRNDVRLKKTYKIFLFFGKIINNIIQNVRYK